MKYVFVYGIIPNKILMCNVTFVVKKKITDKNCISDATLEKYDYKCYTTPRNVLK